MEKMCVCDRCKVVRSTAKCKQCESNKCEICHVDCQMCKKSICTDCYHAMTYPPRVTRTGRILPSLDPVLCLECVNSPICSECRNRNPSKDSGACGCCDSKVCRNCTVRCYGCNHGMCSRCTRECSVCRTDQLCKTCTTRCVICRSTACDDCVNACAVCGAIVCAYCTDSCRACCDTVCKSCVSNHDYDDFEHEQFEDCDHTFSFSGEVEADTDI